MSMRWIGGVGIGLACLGASLEAATVYAYEGDLTPDQGAYGGWFTTIGNGIRGTFPATSWSSNGDVLTMNTYYPNSGIWFGRTGAYGDPSNFSLSTTGDGNLVTARIALSASASAWSLYWYDASGFGSSFTFDGDGIRYYYRDPNTLAGVTGFLPVADMTGFQEVSTYVLAGQVSYFANGQYLGGGAALTGATNFLLLGDGSATDPTGTGSMFVDYLRITTSPLDLPTIPEPGAVGLVMAGGAALLAAGRRARR